MKSLFKLSVNNPVLVHMITLGLIVFGTYMFFTLPRELNPDMSFNWAIIGVTYPGVSPEEMEKLITKPIEDEVADVDKIESITSIAAEGNTTISVKFDQDISQDEFDKLYQDLRTELDKVQDLPADAEDPWLFKLDSNTFQPLIDVVLSGDLPEKEMRELAEELQDDVESIPYVSQVYMAGTRQREIWVEVDPSQLDRHSLALSQVVQALAAKNLNIPGGKLRVGRSEYLLRTVGEVDSVDQIHSVIVRQLPGGNKIRVGDIAQVQDTYEEQAVISRLDGKPSVTLTVVKRTGGSTIKIVNQVKELVEKYRRERLPDGAKLTFVSETSIYVLEFLGTLQNNALAGAVLVVAVLYMFLGLRNAILVALGIPTTLLATFILMKMVGASVNQSSLFAVVLMLGIIVDDTIVVVENVYRRMQQGEPRRQAAVEGIYEVAWPITAAFFTMLAAFFPLALLSGIVGKFMRVIPLVVALTLIASQLECFFILPSHLADWGRDDRSKFRNRLMRLLLKPYTKLLLGALRYRYWVFGGVVVCLILSIALVPLIGVDMFRSDEIPTFFVYVTLPPGTRLETTDAVMRQFEAAAFALPKSEVKAVITRTGLISTDSGSSQDSNLGSLTIELVEQKHRKRSIDEVIADLRQTCSYITGPEQVEFKKLSTGPPTGKDVQAMVRGKYFHELETIVEELKGGLAKIPGVTDINDNYSSGKEELKLYINEDKADEYGLTVQQIALAVRNAFEGAKATVFRDGDEEIDVIVKFDESSRRTTQNVEDMKLVGTNGVLVPLRDVARISVERGYAQIHRFKRERAITIAADVNQEIISPIKVNQMLQAHFEKIKPRYPGYSLTFEGEFAEFNKAFAGILRLFGIGIFLIYFILAVQFKSFIQPIIIMMTVPFAFIGAMLGLITSGNSLSIASMYGFVALAGIVVNDSIVLIEFINRQRAEGISKWRSIASAGRTRLRPILLISITTIVDLLPMAWGIGGRSETWTPLANTMVWGFAASTSLTLFVIPAFYAIIDDIIRWRGVRVAAKEEVSLEAERVPRLKWAPEPGGDD
jgi:multidrug efflux pump subunit AcrB